LECRIYRATQSEKNRHGMTQWVHGGAGWWMSRRLCQLYVDEATERTSGDDMLVAKIAGRHGIEMIDRPDLYGCDRYGASAGLVAAGNRLITCHPVRPAETVRLWEATRGL
jgi:hypothetical protein